MNEEFNDARLVALYDALNPWSDSHEFYLGLADRREMSILDLGCGTGMLACAFAKRGHRVVGVDPAEAMLEKALTRPGADQVEWHLERAQTFQLPRCFDLIIMTGHAFQFLQTDYDIQAALATMRKHLAMDGRAVFEIRNPLKRAWATWDDPDEIDHLTVASSGPVSVWTTIGNEDADQVTFTMHYQFGTNTQALRSTASLRLLTRSQLERITYSMLNYACKVCAATGMVLRSLKIVTKLLLWLDIADPEP